MNDEKKTGDCGCWKVDLPPRTPDFREDCACDERCRCRIGKRVRLTAAGLLLCLVAGVAIGIVWAKFTNEDNVAALRSRYLTNVENGGTGR